MDFVGDHQYIPLVTELGQTYQCFSVPNHTARVVRIGEYQHTAFIIADLLQVVKVHLVQSVSLPAKGIEDHLAVVVCRHQAEWVVYWWLDDNFFVFFNEYVYGHAYALYYARDEGQPFGLDLPSVMLSDPFAHGGPVVFGYGGVAKDGVLHSLFQRINNEGGCLEIHVGHPQGNQV